LRDAIDGEFRKLWLSVQSSGSTRPRVSISGLRGLNEGQKVSYEVAMERGKAAATNLKLA
jgi:hypothetical protein